METLIERLCPGLPGDALSDIFDLLIYRMDDNGEDMVPVLRDWLASDDILKADAALSITTLYLYDTREKMQASLTPIAERFPELAPKVTDLLNRWDADHPSSTTKVTET